MPNSEQAYLREEGAEAEAATTSTAAGSSGWKAWLPLAVAVFLMPALAYGMTRFVLLPQLQKDLGINTPKPSEAKTNKKEGAAVVRETVQMNKLLVNVAGTMGGRFLLVSLSVTGADPDFKAKVQAHDPQLRDLACGALATKTIADLEKPGARNLIRSELISGFNNVLGGAVIQELYLTEFAIQ